MNILAKFEFPDTDANPAEERHHNCVRAVICVNALANIPDPSAYLSRVAAMEEALSGLVAWHENNTLHRTGCECGGTSDGGKTWCGQQVQLLAKAKQALEGAGDGT